MNSTVFRRLGKSHLRCLKDSFIPCKHAVECGCASESVCGHACMAEREREGERARERESVCK